MGVGLSTGRDGGGDNVGVRDGVNTCNVGVEFGTKGVGEVVTDSDGGSVDEVGVGLPAGQV